MEAHGGYLCRLEDVDAGLLQRLAGQALQDEGVTAAECGLLVSVLPRRKVHRFAFDAVHTYGRKGARWYERHHAFARVLSTVVTGTVHAYCLDPDELELVASYGGGRRVGGERLVYEDADFPDEELDERTFERLKDKWPLGHLATVLGLSRDELIRCPRAATALIPLDSTPVTGRVSELLPALPEGSFRRPQVLEAIAPEDPWAKVGTRAGRRRSPHADRRP